MTDYYVSGRGHTAYGPFTLEDARRKAAEIAADCHSVKILATVETPKGALDEELKESYQHLRSEVDEE